MNNIIDRLSYLLDVRPILFWFAISIPCGLFTGSLIGALFLLIGYQFFEGLIGGFLGIVLAYALIGIFYEATG